MLRGGVSSVVAQGFGGKYGALHADLDVQRRSSLRDGGILCNGIGYVGGLRVRRNSVRSVRVTSSPSSGFNPITILSLGGRRHHRRRDPPGGLVSAKKQRGYDTVEITLDFDELKQRAGEAAVATKKALVSSVGNARQVRQSGTQPRCCVC